jgi:putative transposase
MHCYRFVADRAAHHSVRLLSRVLGVSRSGYYAWRDRRPSARARADGQLAERIRRVHERSRGPCGSPRIHAGLRADGQRCGRRRVARLMRESGLRGVHGQRRRGRTTVADRLATPAPDRVGRAFAPAQIGAPNRLWLTDITYVPTDEGWLYRAVVLDGFSRAVVGWAMADHLRPELALDALTMALQTRRPAPGLVLHSDHGCQYTALAFRQRLHAPARSPRWAGPGTPMTTRSPNHSSLR